MNILKNTLLSSCLLLISMPSMAVMVYLPGDTVDFYYESDDIDSIFGSIYVSGDTIFATPNLFKVSSNSDVVNSVSGSGTIQIVVKSGYEFTGTSVGESGVYNTSGTGTVSVDASLRLFDWDDPAPVFGTEETTNLSSTTDFSLNDGNNHVWSASGGFDMTTSLWSDVTHVGLSLTNLLKADGGVDGDAYIDKSAVGAIGFAVETAVIPVPAAAWLFGSGLLGLAGIARRKA